MVKRCLMFLLIVISFMGCAFFHKTQNKEALLIPALSQEVTTPDNDEKVWVEAETKKVWVNNHVDESGDMVEGHYKHIIVTPGHWAVKEGGKE